MIDVNDLRKGVIYEMDNNLYRVLEYSFNKPGRGNATIRVKARDLRKGNTLEKTFTSGERIKDVRLDFHNVQFLYSDSDFYYFMDNETFEQPGLKADMLGDTALYLVEGMEVKLTFYEGEAIDIEIPTSVDLKVEFAEASVRGDTATGVTKKVKTSNGLEVQCPNFINVGDTIRVDTRTGAYLTRA